VEGSSERIDDRTHSTGSVDMKSTFGVKSASSYLRSTPGSPVAAGEKATILLWQPARTPVPRARRALIFEPDQSQHCLKGSTLDRNCRNRKNWVRFVKCRARAMNMVGFLKPLLGRLVTPGPTTCRPAENTEPQPAARMQAAIRRVDLLHIATRLRAAPDPQYVASGGSPR
jgi:hypothetical protein